MSTFLRRLSTRQLTRGLCIAATALGAMSCEQSGEYSLLVRVSGAPADVQTLDVSFLLDGKAAPGAVITEQLNYFGVKLPAGTTGRLAVYVGALGADRCKSAVGTTSIDLSAGRYQETTVSLAAINPRLCSLYSQSSGEGELSISPPGTSCGPGCADYPAGTMVTATFNPTGSSFGAQLSLDAEAVCDGVAPCSFTMKKRTQLTASFNPRLCLSSKWCWYNPLPQGSQLTAFGGTGPNDIWAVGRYGTILHYDGKIWSVSPSGTPYSLFGVWASSANEAWAVGEGGLLLRWNGGSWMSPSSGTTTHLRSVWGSSGSDIWAVGDGGIALRYNGSTWSAVSTGTTENLSRVRGSSANNVWAVGPAGTVIRFAGSAWSAMPVPGNPMTTWNDVWVSATGSDTWLVGLTSVGSCINARFDGSLWDSKTGCAGGGSVWGSSPTDVWTAGGTLASLSRNKTQRPDGFLPEELYQPALYPGRAVPSISTIWGVTPGEVYVGTVEGNLFKRSGDTKTTILTAPASAKPSFVAVTGSGQPDDLFVLQQDGNVRRFDGRQLTTQTSSGGPSIGYDAWAAPVPSGDLFVASSNSNVYRYSVSTNMWTMRANPTAGMVYSIGGTSAAEIYIGASGGILHRYDGTSFTRLNSTAFMGNILSIWMRAPADGWAVGDAGLTVRISGGSASTVANPPAAGVNLNGVGGLPSGQSVWVVGAGGYIARYDGTAWTKIPSGTTQNLSGVAVFSESDVWFVGNQGTLLHWDDKQITSVPSGTTADLRKIWGTPMIGLWLAGNNGVLMRYKP